MSLSTYPEIEKLKAIFKKFKVEIIVSKVDFISAKKDYPSVKFSINDRHFNFFVKDEYSDLGKGEPALSLCLVLRELEDYNDAENYMAWCKECDLDSDKEEVKKYYSNLDLIYKDISKIIGKIDSQINNYDFGLNAGAAKKLRMLGSV